MKGKKLTAGDLKCPDRLNKLIWLDEGFRVLKNVRGSPSYFERCKKFFFFCYDTAVRKSNMVLLFFSSRNKMESAVKNVRKTGGRPQRVQ